MCCYFAPSTLIEKKMKTIKNLMLLMAIVACGSCNNDNDVMAQATSTTSIKVTIDDMSMTLALVDNNATRALVEALADGPITYTANDYGGFEKVGYLGQSLPTSNSQITTQPGDVVLYNGNQIVMFYGSNSWSYTRLGELQHGSIEELKSFLKAGEGSVSVTLELPPTSTVISTVSDDAMSGDGYYTSLGGVRVKNPSQGIYIKNGKKVIIR